MNTKEGTIRAALGYPAFRSLLAGLAVSQVGDWMYNLALVTLVYQRGRPAGCERGAVGGDRVRADRRARWAPAALLLTGFTGAGAICVEVMTETGLQRMLDEVFGRANGLALPAAIAGIAVGSLIAPALVSAFGQTAALLACGGVVVAYCAVVCRFREAEPSAAIPRRAGQPAQPQAAWQPIGPPTVPQPMWQPAVRAEAPWQPIGESRMPLLRLLRTELTRFRITLESMWRRMAALARIECATLSAVQQCHYQPREKTAR